MTFPEAFSGTTESGTGKMMTDFKNLAEGVSGNYTIIEDEKEILLVTAKSIFIFGMTVILEIH